MNPRMMKIKELLAKITVLCRREIRKQSGRGLLLAILYRTLSSSVVQCLINAFFAFYASAYAMINEKLNWRGIAVYCIVLLSMLVVNQHRTKQYKRMDLVKNVLEQYATVIDLTGDDMFDLMNLPGTVNILDNTSQAVVSSVYEAFREYYNEKDFKISIVQNFKDSKKALYCKMTAYNAFGAIPERHRTKYYHSDIVDGKPNDYPFFARVLSEAEKDKEHIGNRGEIYIKNRDTIKQLFEDSQRRNGTQQYLGILAYSVEHHPIMLLQVCANFEDGFGNAEDADTMLNTVLIPYIKQLYLAYEIQCMHEQQKLGT